MTEQRRLAAIVSADVAGYSRLMGRDESGTLAALKALRREVVDPAIANHGGRIVKTTGDGLLLEFPSVVNAVRCAVEVQTAMADRTAELPEDKRIAFRIGLNIGDIIVEGDDIFGDGVNVAARLQEIAPPGGICMSSRVHEDVRDRLDTAFEDGGTQTLKNIARPVQVWRWQPATAVSPPALAPTALPLPDKPSIAVLPFQNMSGDPEQEYFVDGMAEDIITALSRFPTLLVIARNSSFTYKGKAVDIKQVGRELGVRYVLEGGVRKGGNRIRITAQLIDASTGNHVWADRYDRELTDVFAVQDEITATITARLGTSIERVEIDVSGRKSPSNLGAYDYYLRARAFRHNSSGREEGLQARAFCEKAIEIDPQFAPPYAEASYSYSREVAERWDVSRRQEAITKGLAMATRAIALDPALSIAHMTMGMLLFRARDYKGAATSGLRAIELNPNDPESYVARGNMLYYTNNSREALALFQTAQLLNPFYPPIYDYFLGRCYLGHGELDHAIVHSRACSRRLQNFWPPQAILAAAYAHAGDMVEAQAALAEMMRLYPVGSLARYKQEGDYQPGPETDYLYEGLRLAGLPE
jgi:TolB-like protein/class 3 adenylate cyclase/tetratricopeptide (TPR) repeat protein